MLIVQQSEPRQWKDTDQADHGGAESICAAAVQFTLCHQPGPASKGEIASAPLLMLCLLLCSAVVVVCFY